MNCKKIKHIIMTDYSDGELGSDSLRLIEEHLEICRHCREFKATVEERAKLPFKDAGDLVPPESVWHNIKEAISQEEENFIPAKEFPRFLDLLFGLRKPALAFVSSLAILVIALSVLRKPSETKEVASYFEEGAAFFAYLDGESNNGLSSDSAELGTAIEEYLL